MAAGFDITSFADGIGLLVAAGGAILVAIFGDKRKIAPPVKQAVLLYRMGCLITVLTVIIMWNAYAAAPERLAGITVAWFGAALACFILYLFGRAVLTVQCDDDPEIYLGGLWKHRAVKERLGQPGEPADARGFFCGNNRNGALIWPTGSRFVAGAILTVLYAALILTATGAMTAGWLLYIKKPPQDITQPPPPPPPPTPPQVGTITLPADLLFEFGRASLTPGAANDLAAVAGRLRSQHPSQITIGGHTDSHGSERLNLSLSERRASAVYQWLVGPGCLDPRTITARGYGASQPVAPNVGPDGQDYPEGRTRNRRVEIRFVLRPPGDPAPPARPCPAP